jgi:hypothetical protein
MKAYTSSVATAELATDEVAALALQTNCAWKKVELREHTQMCKPLKVFENSLQFLLREVSINKVLFILIDRNIVI